MRTGDVPDFWRDFEVRALESGFDGKWNGRTALQRHEGSLVWSMRARAFDSEAELLIEASTRERNAELFAHLKARMETIEQRFGGALVWDDKPGRVRHRVATPTSPGGLETTDAWAATWSKLLTSIRSLEEALRPELDGFRQAPRSRAALAVSGDQYSESVPGSPNGARLERSQLHRYVEGILIEAELLTVDNEGITRLDGRRAPLRATRAGHAEVGWECEVEVGSQRTGERRLADTYLVAEIAPDTNDIVRLRAWDADSVRHLLTGKPSHDRGNPGWTHGLRLHLTDPRVEQLATDLTTRLW